MLTMMVNIPLSHLSDAGVRSTTNVTHASFFLSPGKAFESAPEIWRGDPTNCDMHRNSGCSDAAYRQHIAGRVTA
jgi:hypothetical protein